MSSTIHIRVTAKLKKAAQKVAEANGLDLSSAIRMYLTFMEVRGTIPVPRLTVNGFTEEEEQELLKRMKGPFVEFDNVDEAIRSFRRKKR
ncbi:type II toxin-antitoxin system RelB/DinJ family antitoxin [Candidatus Peregrinibacteria bacterium]|nr:type II toxin-antitoxin system RelB/DinJ family antitoxin [Candidatus Peregrinibacteria bacterium]